MKINRLATFTRTALFTSIASLSTFALPARAEVAHEAWRTIFDQSVAAGQASNATAIDSHGNVIVVGYLMSASSSDKSFFTAKYSALDGSLVWSRTYQKGPGDTIANAVAVDNADNVIVTGRATDAGGGANYYTAKYKAEDGAILWGTTFAGPQGGADIATKVVVDSQNDVIVTGTSYGNGTQEDWCTIKYASLNGLELWNVRTNGAGNQKDVPADLAIDSQNNPVIAGRVVGSNGKSLFYTLKMNGSNGATIWAKAADPGTTGNNEATALAIDSSDRVVVTGFGRQADNSRIGYTAAYSAAVGNLIWSHSGDFGDDNFSGGPADVTVDAAGDVYVAGTLTVSNITGFLVEKLQGGNSLAAGSLLWQRPGYSPGGAGAVAVGKIVSDASGNVVVTAFYDSNILTFRLAGAAGDPLSIFIYDGSDGDARSTGLALDQFGNIAVTGITSLKFQDTNIRYNRIVTLKYDRLRIAVGDPAPGAGVAGLGIPEDATITSVSTPSLADSGALAVKVGIRAGKKNLEAILLQSAAGSSKIVALEGLGADGYRYGSFLDPVISPDGRVAFTGKLAGAPAGIANAVWVTDGEGNALLRLQSGRQVTGLDAGVLLKSVASISWRNGELIALIQVTGAGVTKDNSTILYGSNEGFGSSALLRTGTPIAVPGADSSTIASLSTFLPAKGSPGQGRSFSATSLVTRAMLKDKSSVVLAASILGGAPSVLAYPGQTFSAGSMNGAFFTKTLGIPAMGTANKNYAVAATFVLQHGLTPSSEVTAKNDSALIFSSDGGSFNVIAREGDIAPGTGGYCDYASFLDPLVNDQGDVAFVGTLSGPEVTAKNKTALWWGAASQPANLEIVARTGAAAPDSAGVVAPDAPTFSSILSTALPGGPNAAPIFTAKLSGHGVSGKNNTALYAVDSTGLVRQLLRTGDSYGESKVTAFQVLNAVSGSLGVTHNFNAKGGIDALVALDGKTKGVLHLAIP